MKAAWCDGFDQRVVVDEMVRLASAGRPIGFDGQGAGLLTLIRSMIDFSEALPWQERYDLLQIAVRNAVESGASSPKDLLAHIQEAAKPYAGRTKLKFVMYSSVSVSRQSKLSGMRIGNVSLTFLDKLPAKVKASRAELFHEHRRWLPVDHEPDTKVFRAEVLASSAEDAALQCLDAIDMIRGVWNFNLTASWRHTVAGPRQPLSAIFLGPMHTFHDASGAAKSDQFWYETTYWRQAAITNLTDEDRRVVSKSRQVRRLLSRHLYSADLEKAFVRYARALDLEDHDLAIQRLWSLLEYLTDTGFASYDKTIRRARFIYEDTAYQGQVLEHLRRYRNRSVHAGMSSGDVEVEVYQLKRIVEAMIRFHLGNRFRFPSLKEACDLLDLSPDSELLKAKLAQIRKAVAFRESREA